jgi:hypothetical protein
MPSSAQSIRLWYCRRGQLDLRIATTCSVKADVGVVGLDQKERYCCAKDEPLAVGGDEFDLVMALAHKLPLLRYRIASRTCLLMNRGLHACSSHLVTQASGSVCVLSYGCWLDEAWVSSSESTRAPDWYELLALWSQGLGLGAAAGSCDCRPLSGLCSSYGAKFIRGVGSGWRTVEVAKSTSARHRSSCLHWHHTDVASCGCSFLQAQYPSHLRIATGAPVPATRLRATVHTPVREAHQIAQRSRTGAKKILAAIGLAKWPSPRCLQSGH